MIDSLDQVARQQFSTFLLASESFHELRRLLSNASKQDGKVVRQFEAKLADFLDKATVEDPNESVEAILSKLKDLAFDLKHKGRREHVIIERCQKNIEDRHKANSWNCEQHLEHLHQLARFWTCKFFDAYPGGSVVLPQNIKWTLKFLPNGGQSEPLMSCTHSGPINVHFSFAMQRVYCMDFHHWHLCCPLMFMHEYASHIAVKHRTFFAMDDGWMLHAARSFLNKSALVSGIAPNQFNISEFQIDAAQRFPLSNIEDDDVLGCLWIADRFERFLDLYSRGDKFHSVALTLYAVAVRGGQAVKYHIYSAFTKLDETIRPYSGLQEAALRALDRSVKDFLEFLGIPAQSIP